jgi:hypothetical protein
MGGASLVLGIIDALIAIIPILGMYAIPFAALALIFGFLGRSKPKGKGLAIAGIVLGLIGIGLGGWQYSLYRKAKEELTNPKSNFNKAVDKAAAEAKDELNKQLGWSVASKGCTASSNS